MRDSKQGATSSRHVERETLGEQCAAAPVESSSRWRSTSVKAVVVPFSAQELCAVVANAVANQSRVKIRNLVVHFEVSSARSTRRLL